MANLEYASRLSVREEQNSQELFLPDELLFEFFDGDAETDLTNLRLHQLPRQQLNAGASTSFNLSAVGIDYIKFLVFKSEYDIVVSWLSNSRSIESSTGYFVSNPTALGSAPTLEIQVTNTQGALANNFVLAVGGYNHSQLP